MHLQEIDEAVHRRLDEMLLRMAMKAGVTDDLKKKLRNRRIEHG